MESRVNGCCSTFVREFIPWMPCPEPWGPSWQSSVPQSGKHERSSHGQPCGTTHLRKPWRPSCVWDCVWRVRRTSLAWYPSAWLRSWDTWARMVASWGTGRPACLRVFGRCVVCSTWCCTTGVDGTWYVGPSLLLKFVVHFAKKNGSKENKILSIIVQGTYAKPVNFYKKLDSIPQKAWLLWAKHILYENAPAF